MGTPAPTNLPKDWAAPSRSRPILPQRRASFPSYGETVASSYLSRCLLKVSQESFPMKKKNKERKKGKKRKIELVSADEDPKESA